jgi:undecaprenyl-diphosphatase
VRQDADVAAGLTEVGALRADALDDDLVVGPAWRRHPIDVARLVVSLAALAACTALVVRHAGPVRSVSVDVVDLVAELPRWVRELLIGTTQLLALAVPVAVTFVLARSPRLLAAATAGALAAGLAMALLQGRIDDAVPHRVVLVTQRTSWITGAAFPSGAYLAGLTAAFVILGPALSRGWRRAAVVGIGIAAFGRIVTVVAVPVNVAITLALGAAVGSAVLAAIGSPRRTVSRRQVLDGLARAGYPAAAIEPADVGSTHALTFWAHAPGDRKAFVKLLGRDQRSADLLYRAWRSLRVKDLDDERPSWTPTELADHDAFTALLAASNGVPTPQVLAVGATEGGDGLLALEVVEGRPLADLSDEQMTDELLDAAWAALVGLRSRGIAHRWLTAKHLLADPTHETVSLIDFRWAVHQADADQLAADIAMLAVSLATVVGAERSVAAAARVLTKDELASALPLVQPLALPDDLRDQVKGNKAILPLLRKQLQHAAGDVPYKLADIERISLKQLLSLFGLVVVSYTLLGFISNWSDIVHALRQVSLADVPLLVTLAAVPYVAGAATFASVVPKPLPFGEVVRLMFGQSFLNRFTPANAGGMALRVRYLQKRGVDIGGAAAGVALTGVASGIGQIAVLATFGAWAGSSGGKRLFSLPKASHLAVGGAALAVLASVVWLTPWGQKVVKRRIETTAKSVWTTLRALAHQPGRFVTLFATTIGSKVAVIVAFAASARALDISLSFPKLGLLYLTASTLAGAAPTPGGVGAVEAALTAALTGAGASPADALSAVFVFRLATFWLPVPFGYVALQRLQHGILAE